MTTIITKNSSTASAVPLAADLVQGELAVNVTDKRVYTKNASAAVIEVGTNPSIITTTTVNGLTVGKGAGSVATNTAVGASALAANTTGSRNTAFGRQALLLNQDGAINTAVGQGALAANVSGNYNSAFGDSALYSNTTGSSNTGIGFGALASNTTASNNTAVGYQAGYSDTTGEISTFIGAQAGYFSTGGSNTFVGSKTGYNVTTGIGNTFIGSGGVSGVNNSAGYFITTGSKNTIVGNYTGNQGGLDIRTASNRVILSDGDGNVRIACDATGSVANGYFMAFDGLEWYAGVDNAIKLGTASNRYTTVYATTGTINTSDANQKQDIANLDDAEKRVAVAIKSLIKKYRFKDSVVEKGDAARIHIGAVAQEVQAAFVAQGLDPARYALFCSDTWYEVNGNSRQADGTLCKSDTEGAIEVTRLGLRYEELLAFVIAAL